MEQQEKRIGNIYGFDGGNYAGNVYDNEGLSPTIKANSGGNTQPMIIDDTQGFDGVRAYDDYSPALRAERSGLKTTEPVIVAMRGRNPDNLSDRTAGMPTEQRLEVNTQGTSNCLTSVGKDNMVLENAAVLTPKRTEYGKAIRKAYESGEVQESRHNMTELEPRQDGVSNTLTTVQKDNMVLESSGGYRIRKLTPRECGRLMGVTDDDIDKMAKVNSNSQLYKQFGNSIVVAVMVAMFSNLHIKGVKAWEDMTTDEREAFVREGL